VWQRAPSAFLGVSVSARGQRSPSFALRGFVVEKQLACLRNQWCIDIEGVGTANPRFEYRSTMRVSRNPKS
jgi:hypothetical protein